MTMHSVTPTSAKHEKREPLNLRVKPEDRSLIDRAAKVQRKDRTSFILDAARVAAEEALFDQTVVLADPKAYAAFLTRLDAPASTNDRLRKTMRAPAPWKKQL